MPTYYYMVNGFSNARTGWIRTGASPYLDAIDYPANLIAANVAKKGDIGDFSFQDPGSEKDTESLTSVYLEIYANGDPDPDIGYAPCQLYIYDGSTWFNLGSVMPTSWAWYSKDVSSQIDTWSKVISALAYFSAIPLVLQVIRIDAARLKVNTVPAPAVPKIMMDGLVFVG